MCSLKCDRVVVCVYVRLGGMCLKEDWQTSSQGRRPAFAEHTDLFICVDHARDIFQYSSSPISSTLLASHTKFKMGLVASEIQVLSAVHG